MNENLLINVALALEAEHRQRTRHDCDGDNWNPECPVCNLLRSITRDLREMERRDRIAAHADRDE